MRLELNFRPRYLQLFSVSWGCLSKKKTSWILPTWTSLISWSNSTFFLNPSSEIWATWSLRKKTRPTKWPVTLNVVPREVMVCLCLGLGKKTQTLCFYKAYQGTYHQLSPRNKRTLPTREPVKLCRITWLVFLCIKY